MSTTLPAPRTPKRLSKPALAAWLALLAALPFVVKRGCHFQAHFDPIHARTNAVTNATSRPQNTPLR